MDMCKFQKKQGVLKKLSFKTVEIGKSMLVFGLNILPERNSYDKNAMTKDTVGI